MVPNRTHETKGADAFAKGFESMLNSIPDVAVLSRIDDGFRRHESGKVDVREERVEDFRIHDRRPLL